MTAFPNMVVEMNERIADGDQVIYHWTLIGTNTGPGGTGNAVRINGYEQWTIGSISKYRPTAMTRLISMHTKKSGFLSGDSVRNNKVTH